MRMFIYDNGGWFAPRRQLREEKPGVKKINSEIFRGGLIRDFVVVVVASLREATGGAGRE